MNAVDNKCPSCNANIKFNPTTQRWDCEYCGSSFTVEDFENKQKKEQNVEDEQCYTNMNEYSCPNCGAVVITDENTVATSCVYCGNTTIMKNRLQGDFKPNKIIAFKSKKEDAIEAFQKNVKKRWFAPSDFSKKENIEKISGVYIPFWLFDGGVSGSISAEAIRTRRWTSGDYRYSEENIYNCERAGNIEVTDVPVDGSSKFEDEIMDSIEPFDYSEFVEFNQSYLSGFLAEKYDLTSDDVYERAENRMEETITSELRNSISGFDSVYIKNKDIHIKKGDVEYALLPVWMLNIKFKDKLYTFAMNGQTKKTVGYVPKDAKKIVIKSLICFGVSFVIAFLFNYMGGML